MNCFFAVVSFLPPSSCCMGAPRPASPPSIISIAEDCWVKRVFPTSSRSYGSLERKTSLGVDGAPPGFSFLLLFFFFRTCSYSKPSSRVISIVYVNSRLIANAAPCGLLPRTFCRRGRATALRDIFSGIFASAMRSAGLALHIASSPP